MSSQVKVWIFNDPKELDDPQTLDDPREFQLKVWKIQKSTVTVTVAMIPSSLMVLFSLAIPMEIFASVVFGTRDFVTRRFLYINGETLIRKLTTL